MTREELIEAMARAMVECSANDDNAWLQLNDGQRASFLADAKAAASGLFAAIPGLADVIDGKAVIVPVEPTDEMIRAVNERHGIPNHCEAIYDTLIEARPK